jgi:hypothetical protein
MMSKVVVMLKTINIFYLCFSLCRSTPGDRGKGILGPWERG